MKIATTSRALWTGLALAAVAATPLPALAQSSGDEARMRKLESEVRALQRKVFPGGDGRFFEPQITSTPSAGGSVATPSTTAVTDILVRLDAMEAQIAALTAQTEENSNALLLLTDRLVALENSAGGVSSGTGTAVPGTTTSTAAPTTPASTPEPAGPSAERLAAVQQIAKPQTEDAGDDEYS